MSMTSASYQAYYPPGTWRGVNPNVRLPTRMSAPAVAPALPPHFLNGNSQRIQSSPPFDKQAAAAVGFNAPAGVGDVRSLRYNLPSMDAMLLDGAEGKQTPHIAGMQHAPPNPWGKKVAKRTSIDIEKEINAQNLYKTELCRSYVETGACRYGAKCQFAHGKAELRPVLRHPKYKTEICKTFHTIGTCPYGTRCRFIHQRSEVEIADNSIFIPPPQTGVVAPEWSIWKDIVLSEAPASKADPPISPAASPAPPAPAPATVPYARRSTTIISEMTSPKHHKAEKRNSQPIRSGRQRANTLSPPSGRKKKQQKQQQQQQQHNGFGAKPPLKLGAARSNNLSDNGFIGLRHHRRKEDVSVASSTASSAVLEGPIVDDDDDDDDVNGLLDAPAVPPGVPPRSPGMSVDFDSDDDDDGDDDGDENDSLIHHQIDSNANNVGSEDDDDDDDDYDDHGAVDGGAGLRGADQREVALSNAEDLPTEQASPVAPSPASAPAAMPIVAAAAPSVPVVTAEDKRKACVFSPPPVATAAHRARSNSGGNSRLPIFQVLSTAAPEDDAAASQLSTSS